jgi:hypothetical protein
LFTRTNGSCGEGYFFSVSAPVSRIRRAVVFGQSSCIRFSAIAVAANEIVMPCFTIQSRNALASLRTNSSGTCTLAPEARYGHNSHTAASNPNDASALARSAAVT